MMAAMRKWGAGRKIQIRCLQLRFVLLGAAGYKAGYVKLTRPGVPRKGTTSAEAAQAHPTGNSPKGYVSAVDPIRPTPAGKL